MQDWQAKYEARRATKEKQGKKLEGSISDGRKRNNHDQRERYRARCYDDGEGEGQ